MDSALLGAALSKRDLLSSLLTRYYAPEASVGLEWAKAPPGALVRVTHGSVDGGSRTVSLEAYTMYMVKAWGGCWGPVDGGYSSCGEASLADVGLVLPPKYEQERVSVYREILELKAARLVASGRRGGVLLMDGGVGPLIARHRPGFVLGGVRAREELEARAVRRASEVLGPVGDLEGLAGYIKENSGSLGVVSVSVAERLALSGGLEWRDAEWLSFIEWLEKLLEFKAFLEAAWGRGWTVVFVSKTSRSNYLLPSKPLPDVYYYRLNDPVAPGRSRYAVLGAPDLGYKALKAYAYPELDEIEELVMGRLGVIHYYTRLRPMAPILQVNVVYDKSGGGPAEELVVAVESALRSLSTSEGYPSPLLVAHKNSVVREATVRGVLGALGLELERSGRVVLG